MLLIGVVLLVTGKFRLPREVESRDLLLANAQTREDKLNDNLSRLTENQDRLVDRFERQQDISDKALEMIRIDLLPMITEMPAPAPRRRRFARDEG